ncbi:MAG TPA: adenylosuccinate lyase [Candidatus Ornithospirochaeta avicola]|uniref:Adenylosuccinate lyase n=1 Tax=Candidatus Ornithospirochaeta avicola TaxID=2840896 RepID=A0A9D1PUN7_9SPIO|nr:adenylosuccinate lyase [Candidatus Ornithospirochaeta avicola]
MMYDHDTFISPLTWRYGSEEMKKVFSEENKRKLLRRIWIALAKAESEYGLVSKEQLDELIEHKDDVDIKRASEIENEIHHDLMAEIRTYAEQCPKAGGIIHLGATSMDALDNADIIRYKEALEIIRKKLSALIEELANRAMEYKDMPTMAFTHIQPAEITTVGYRLAQTLQDLADDYDELVHFSNTIRAKGFKGAVGTAASYVELLGESAVEFEKKAFDELGLKTFTCSTQIYTRKQDLRMTEVLSNISATLYKFSQDFRILQSPVIGEFSEPFGKKQVGSSAMPFKRNPINSEKIDSLARIVSSSYSTAWNNATSTILERSLDDSANRRIYIPEAFIALDEMIATEIKIVRGMNIHEEAINRLLKNYGIFSATERLLMRLGKKGADRQKMHEIIREESLKAWDSIAKGKENDLKSRLAENAEIKKYMKEEEILEALDASRYTGDASRRTEMICQEAKIK